MNPTAQLQFLQGSMIIYLLKFNWFENTMQFFVPTSKSFQKLPRMIWGRGEEGTWKVDTHDVKGDDNENILRTIITVWMFYQDRSTVLDDSCPLMWNIYEIIYIFELRL